MQFQIVSCKPFSVIHYQLRQRHTVTQLITNIIDPHYMLLESE